MPRGSRRLHAHLFALLGRGVHAAGRRSFSRARQGEGGRPQGPVLAAGVAIDG